MPDLPVAAPDHADLHRQVRLLLHSLLPWNEYVPGVPDKPVSEWGSLAWAHLADALLAERQQDKERIERLTAIADAAKEVYGPGKGSVPVRTWAELGAALAVEEDARPGKPETPGNSGAAVEEDAKNG